MDEFYPKCFIVNTSFRFKDDKLQAQVTQEEDEMNQNNLEEFKEEYRLVWAESIVKKFVQKQKDDPALLPQIYTALSICEKRLMTLDETLEMFSEISDDHHCSQAEW